MTKAPVTITVRRLSDRTSVMEVKGNFTSAAQALLIDALAKVSTPTTTSVVVDFSALEYTDSAGIGLIVNLLAWARRQRLQVFAYGLSEHYREIFAITGIDNFMRVYPDERAALAAAGEP